LAKPAPSSFAPLAGGRGARVNHNPTLILEFRDWVTREFQTGAADIPNDNPDLAEVPDVKIDHVQR
jgi:hypothetical protein